MRRAYSKQMGFKNLGDLLRKYTNQNVCLPLSNGLKLALEICNTYCICQCSQYIHEKSNPLKVMLYLIQHSPNITHSITDSSFTTLCTCFPDPRYEKMVIKIQTYFESGAKKSLIWLCAEPLSPFIWNRRNAQLLGILQRKNGLHLNPK